MANIADNKGRSRGLQMTKTIKEQVVEMGNNETAVAKGVYENEDSTYSWHTFTRSGTCKKLSTAMKNAGF